MPLHQNSRVVFDPIDDCSSNKSESNNQIVGPRPNLHQADQILMRQPCLYTGHEHSLFFSGKPEMDLNKILHHATTDARYLATCVALGWMTKNWELRNDAPDAVRLAYHDNLQNPVVNRNAPSNKRSSNN